MADWRGVPTADYRCDDCGKVVTLELPRPERVELYCCTRDWDAQRDCTDAVQSTYRRVWSPVSIGAVVGAGGSPSR